MKVALVGKGGSGKTTLTSLVARYLSDQRVPVLAIDGDINQHLGESLGLSEKEASRIPAMGLEMERIKKYLVGTNPAIRDVAEMIKTTPPSTGSRLLTVTENNPLYTHFVKEVQGVRLMVVGPFTEEDLGVKCYHSKTGAIEMMLNHLVDRENEYVLVDMTAGVDSFASGLFTRFDITCIVVEPTVKSLGVYKQYKRYAQQYDVCIRAIGNKVYDAADSAFLHEHLGNDLIALFSYSPFVRAAEKGVLPPLCDLEPENRETLRRVQSEIDSQKKDWEKYHRQAVEFHQKNAEGWANALLGSDVGLQVDPSFSLKETVESM